MEISFLTVVQWTSRLMIVPSSCLTIGLIYLILKVTPQSMFKYKFILLLMTIMCYNFDFIVSFAVAPNTFPGVIGAQMVGIIARFWPSGGYWLILTCFLALALQIASSTVGFCYREHSVTKDYERRFHFHLRRFQMAFLMFLICVLIPMFILFADSEETNREYLRNVSVSPCEGCAIFLVTRTLTLQLSGLYVVIFLFLVSFFIGKSIYRIKSTLSSHKNLSPTTIRIQKMLLKALIWQSFLPFVLIIVPCLMITINLVVFPWKPGIRETTQFRQNLTGIAIATPSLFSVAHVFCVVYFTTPYKNYLLSLRSTEDKSTGQLPRRNTMTQSI